MVLVMWGGMVCQYAGSYLVLGTLADGRVYGPREGGRGIGVVDVVIYL